MIMEYFKLTTLIIFVMALGWYLITNLQWYSYKLDRVVFKHHKIHWHIVYFLTPLAFYHIFDFVYFSAYFYILYLSSFIFWNKSLDKKLVLTNRVKRFLAILLFVTFVFIGACVYLEGCIKIGILLPLLITLAITNIIEAIFFLSYKDKARKKLKSMPNLTIIAITASYGKTSIKNYLFQVLQKNFNVYMTPKSVNTIKGIVQDINTNLKKEIDIYIVEAGARQNGDIKEIATLLNHHFAIIGSVGEQHIEYFKTIDNIINTKMEILQSSRLIQGFVHNSVPILKYPTISSFGDDTQITKSNLDGIWFDVAIDDKLEHFYAPILGKFNAINLLAVVLCSHQLGMSIEQIKVALHNLTPVEHRLQKILNGGKLIIDDSFNGNLEGMLEAVKLSSTYEGRRVVVTPGLVESSVKSNIEFARAIDDVFDIVIITGSLNKNVLSQNIKKATLYTLADKGELEYTLAQKTAIGDLILFANDAPNFI